MHAIASSGADRRTTRQVRAVVLVFALIASVLVAAAPASAATPDTDTWYQLINRHSGQALEVHEWSTADGGNVVQFTDLDGANQQWRFVSSGSGYYRLINRNSGKALEVYEWSTADGANVVQWADTGGENQQWSTPDTDSGYIKLLNRNSGQALDLWEWSTEPGANIAQWPDTGGSNQQWQLVPVGDVGDPGDPGDPDPPSGLVGWATQGGGTTGGSGSATTVSSASALEDAVGSGGVVRVSGTISCSGMLRVASNTSILGNSGATIAGCGFNIAEATNVVVRNLTFRDWDDDAINVQYSQRVWIDHNSFTNGNDGAVDIKRESDHVTVSWNHVFDHGKNMLLGHSDDNASEDVGHLRVTYHHNWFDGGTRNPRVRFGDPVHVFNNYYIGNEYGVASTMGGGVLVEGNYFEDVEEPTLVGYAASDPGDLVQRDNFFTGSGSPESAGGVNSIPYSYSLQSASSVKSTVMSGAGAGNISP